MDANGIDLFYLESLISELTGWNNPRERFREALAQDEFVLYAQPMLKLTAGGDNRAHAEILVRLKAHERHLTPPGAFLPILEFYDLGPELDRWIVNRVLSWYRRLVAEIAAVLHINLSAGTVADAGFPAFVEEQCRATGIHSDHLCFEILDTDIQYGLSTAMLIQKLRAAGCHIAMGFLERGNEPFRAAKNVAANYIKIGGQLIRDLPNDQAVVSKVRSIARACYAFRIQTIAEHVENTSVLESLRALDVDYAQGYAVSAPKLLEEINLQSFATLDQRVS